jgi:phosphoserine aminotransferase
VKPKTRSNTSVCLKFTDPAVTALGPDAQANFAKGIVAFLEKEGVGLDLGHYRDAPPGLRIWCGATVQTRDVKALLPWIETAFAAEKAKLSKAA